MDRNRILVIFGAAWVSAALLTWFLYARTKAPQQEKTIKVAAVSRDLPAGAKLGRTDLKLIAIPEKDLPKSALLDLSMAEGRALLFPLTANEPLTANKLSSTLGAEGLSATIPAGMRAVSISATDISAVAGLLQPRSHVDVLFTRPGSMAEALTTTVLEDVTVLSVGRTTEAQQVQSAPVAGAAQQTQTSLNVSQQRAVTLLVTPEEARKLELARNQGRLSLALRNPLDKSRLDAKEAVTAEALDPYLFTRVRRPLPVGANIRDPKAWAQLTGDAPPPAARKVEKKEPAKPRVVVDVFRGDKHLQETFQ
jgi:pilus assembly protein CpaB